MHIGIATQNDWALNRIQSYIPSIHEVYAVQQKDSIIQQCQDNGLDVLFYEVAYVTRSQLTIWRNIGKIPNTNLVLISPVSKREIEEKALRLGAYDVISKPWNELGDDIQRILNTIDNKQLLMQKYELTMRSFHDAIVNVRGKRISLTQTELVLLKVLISSNGRYTPTEELISHIWGSMGSGKKEDLYVYISRLREKLEENPSFPQLIVSSRGFGYTFNGEVSIERE